MAKKKIHIISIQESYLTAISKQLELVFGDKAIISKLIVKDLEMDSIAETDIVLLSKKIPMGVIRPFIPKSCRIILADREINIANAEKIIDLPPGQKIAVINDTLGNAKETVKSLENIFFTHMYYFADDNNLDRTIPDDIDYVVTPGELDFVPSHFNNVIDIGPRLLSYNTLWETAQALGAQFTYEQLANRFVKSQVSLADDKFIMGGESSQTSGVTSKVKLTSAEILHVKMKIEEHGFLEESIKILELYAEGKRNLKTFGRLKLKGFLEENSIFLSEQQLRLRLEVLQELGLLNARQGRGGTTITTLGEHYLQSKE